MIPERRRRLVRNLLDAAAVATALIFIGSYFPSSLMLSPTTTNGGDMGTHFFPAAYLASELLPHGSVVGWCPGNYCGFPLFQFYFPLPFVLIALLSKLIPLTIAFKLITVLGIFLLPVTSYLSLRLMGTPFPGPALAALASLCFLFMEANSMWGGNIPSTLAGEFTYSIGLSLTVLFLGALRYSVRTGRGIAWTGLLEAFVGFAHGYTLLWAGFASLFELVAIRHWWRKLGTLIAIHGLAILLLGFWLVPLLAYSPWTTAYSHVWIIKSWQEVLPPILWPAAIVAVLTALIMGVVSVVRRQEFPRPLAHIWAATLIGGSFYFVANAFHVVDIRFLPFFQLGLCLCAAAGLGYVLASLPTPEIWPVVGALVIVPFAQSYVTFIPSWIRWNYSGFEAKGPWAAFHAVNEKVRGTYRDPRVVYEHAADHEAVGTVRAFENLPYFSGRSTLEGLYMQSSPTAPFVFYLQSEISRTGSCPFPEWGCGALNLARGVRHLRMMNVSQYIVRSAQVKALAAAEPGLEREAVIPPYEVYRVRDNDPRYAIPLTATPVLVETDRWKDVSYRWFKTAGPDDVVPVFVPKAEPGDAELFAGVTSALPATTPRKPLEPVPGMTEEMGTDRITIRGARPGHPVLIRISYHPRWKALTGEKVWLAGPSFMLVFPRGETVELVFGSGPPLTLGYTFTTIGWLLFLGAVLPIRRRLGAIAVELGRGIGDVPPLRPLVRFVRAGANLPATTRYAILAAGVAAYAGVMMVLAVGVRTSDESTLYLRGQAFYGAGKLNEALPFFEDVQRAAPLSMNAIHSAYFESIIHFRNGDFRRALERFESLLERFPEAPSAPEALYHVGICRARLGDPAGAKTAWEQTRERYPTTAWAKHAGDRLAEQRQQAAPPQPAPPQPQP